MRVDCRCVLPGEMDVAAEHGGVWWLCVPVRMAVDVDQQLRGSGDSAVSASAHPFYFAQHKLSSFYADYRPGCALWVVFVCLRKFALVVACSLLHDRPELARHVCVAILLLSIALNGSWQPYVARPAASTRWSVVNNMYVTAGRRYPLIFHVLVVVSRMGDVSDEECVVLVPCVFFFPQAECDSEPEQCRVAVLARMHTSASVCAAPVNCLDCRLRCQPRQIGCDAEGCRRHDAAVARSRRSECRCGMGTATSSSSCPEARQSRRCT